MNHSARFVCLLLALLMVLSMTGCGGGSDLTSEDVPQGPTQNVSSVPQEPVPGEGQAEPEAPQASGDPEVDQAIELGLVPEELQGSYDAQITYAEYCGMLDILLGMTLPNALPVWRDHSSTFHDASQPMTRGEGTVVLLYAVMAAGFDRAEFMTESNFWLEGMLPEGQDFWEGEVWGNPLIPGQHEQYENDSFIGTSQEWKTGFDILTNAGWFAEIYSYQNGKPYFDYDPETYSMRFGDPFTRAEAVQSVYRLYGGLRFIEFVPSDSVPCGVTEDAIRLAQEMPAAAWNDIPDWKGYTITSPFDGYGVGECGKYFYEEEVARIAADGFDFVRATVNFQTVFGQSGGTEQVRGAFVSSMDDLVNWCAKYGIHLCFDSHAFPGFDPLGGNENITLWDDPEQQELFCAFWGWMAEHYQNVPSNLLSFNLINESRGPESLSDEDYSSLMKKAISAIREYSPDRLIFADALGVAQGIPVEGLADAQVAQAIHPYFLPDGASQWPTTIINGFIHRNNGVLTLEGDFPAGTSISIDIDMIHQASTMRWLADGKETESLEIGTEAVGEGGCIDIGDPGTGGESRAYENRTWTVQLPEPARRLQLIQEEGWWYSLNGIAVETPAGVTTIMAQHDFVPSEKVPELTIQSDGTVTAADPDTLFCLDRDALADRFAQYTAFRDRTGVEIMVQEFGFDASIPRETARPAADALLSVLDEAGIPWCSFCSQWGLWVSKSEELVYSVQGNPSPIRSDGHYQDLGDWYYDTDMAEIYHKYMAS